MKSFEIYNENLVVNGKISKVFLQNELQAYEENVKKEVKRLLRDTELKGDAFVDKFFNEVDEQSILEFQNNEVVYTLTISRSYGPIDEDVETQSVENFGSNYLIEHRDTDSNLLDISDFSLGEEDALIQALHEFGFDLNEVSN